MDSRYGAGDTYNSVYAIGFHREVNSQGDEITSSSIDAACKRGIASLINHGKSVHPRDQPEVGVQYANCYWRKKPDAKTLTPTRIFVEAKRDIKHGQELRIDYGGKQSYKILAADYDDTDLYSNPPNIRTCTEYVRARAVPQCSPHTRSRSRTPARCRK
ncbi:hypothetical protein JKP88DRAFT_251604 [Tribonema minus]|uniref:SET domain-containing protein n=1 Tax=Tribonema minus TaxID=303371 RepID=A0A835ZFJ9_9STRA|nr:hypothetical protein JKP88DRAFT_251604 [Tribonema minus]